MAAITALYILSLRGDVLIARTYRDDADPALPAAFRAAVLGAGRPSTSSGPAPPSAAAAPPVRQLGGAHFLHARHGDVRIVAVTRGNANAAAVFALIGRLVAVMRSYFGGEFDENAIRNNFVLVYELLDEAIDAGWPQTTDEAALKALVFEKGFVTAAARARRDAAAAAATLQVTGAVGWRRDGIKYKKNEVFLDVVETVNALVSSRGAVLRADVVGRVNVKAFLSGMPDVKLGLNDAPADVAFHPCVNLARYGADRVASFVPPDGAFELMRYRCGDGVALPFRLLPVVAEVGRTRIDVSLKLKAAFDPRLSATGVVVTLPLPPTAAAADIVTSHGKAKYDPKKGALVWKMRRLAGGAEASAVGAVRLVSTTREPKPWGRAPAQVTFEVPMFSASGLRIQYLKVWEKSNYRVDKWVRKLAVAGDFAVRV